MFVISEIPLKKYVLFEWGFIFKTTKISSLKMCLL